MGTVRKTEARTSRTKTVRDPERVSFDRYADLPGIEILRVERSSRLWRWDHTDYCVCTPTKFRGRGEYVYRGASHVVSEEDQPVMQPGEVHVTQRATAPASFRVLFIAPRVLEEGADTLGFGRVPDLSAAPIRRANLLRTFRRLHASLEDPMSDPLERQARLTDGLRLFLETAAKMPVPRQVDPATARVRRMEDLLRAAGPRSITLDDLSSASGLSRFHLVRAFSRVTGLPPHKYLMLLRVQHARRLLAAGQSIQQAARDAGFVDASHLGRNFRQVAGVTPGTYATGGDRTLVAIRRRNRNSVPSAGRGVAYSAAR